MKLEFMIHSIDPIYAKHIQESKEAIPRLCIDRESGFYGNISGSSRRKESVAREQFESVGWYEYHYVRLA
jgi:hypothetical protein